MAVYCHVTEIFAKARPVTGAVFYNKASVKFEAFANAQGCTFRQWKSLNNAG